MTQPAALPGLSRIQGLAHVQYSSGHLSVEDVAVDQVAAAVGTPCYIYSAATIAGNLAAYQTAFRGQRHRICYALKANANLAIIRHIANTGAGFDAVSGGEIAKARAAGVSPDHLVFAGVGKTKVEMHEALSAGIRQFNVESLPELAALNDVAASLGVKAPVALRVNPDVDPGTHEKIATGRSANKFGIAMDGVPAAWRAAESMDHIRPVGLALHIGSQILSLEPYRLALTRATALIRSLRSSGAVIDSLDIGGGLGVAYRADQDHPPAVADYARMVKETLGDLDCELLLEPGRSIVGSAGLLTTTVLYVKEGQDRTFLVLDAAMNDLLRPALYDAWHDIVPLREPDASEELIPYDIVGPVCESSDTFARYRHLPPLAAGDQVAFLNAGAYGSAMASEYNCRPLIPEVLVNGRTHAVIRARPSTEDMISRDIMPDWLEDPPGTG